MKHSPSVILVITVGCSPLCAQPSIPAANEESIQQHYAAGVRLNTQRRFAEARQELLLAIGAAEQRNPNDPRLGGFWNDLGMANQDLGETAEAERNYLRSIAILEANYGPDHRSIALPLSNLASLYKDERLFTKAERRSRQAESIRIRAKGPRDPLLVPILNVLGEILFLEGRLDDAEEALRRAVALSDRDARSDGPPLNNLATVLWNRGNREEAAVCWQRALASIEADLGSEHPSTVIMLNNLAVYAFSAGRYAEAATLAARALRTIEKSPQMDERKLPPMLENYAVILKKLNRKKEARQLEARAKSMLTRNPQPRSRAMIDIHDAAAIRKSR